MSNKPKEPYAHAALNLKGVAARDVDSAFVLVQVVACQCRDVPTSLSVEEHRASEGELVRPITAAHTLSAARVKPSGGCVERVRRNHVQVRNAPAPQRM